MSLGARYSPNIYNLTSLLWHSALWKIKESSVDPWLFSISPQITTLYFHHVCFYSCFDFLLLLPIFFPSLLRTWNENDFLVSLQQSHQLSCPCSCFISHASTILLDEPSLLWQIHTEFLCGTRSAYLFSPNSAYLKLCELHFYASHALDQTFGMDHALVHEWV